jgi:proteic killer suppression protein
MPIQSFGCAETEAIFGGHRSKRFQSIQHVAERKLLLLHAAAELSDLGSPPGNRLEALKGKRHGQYSIRINDQYRLCFRWTPGGPADVEIVDYHK